MPQNKRRSIEKYIANNKLWAVGKSFSGTLNLDDKQNAQGEVKLAKEDINMKEIAQYIAEDTPKESDIINIVNQGQVVAP